MKKKSLSAKKKIHNFYIEKLNLPCFVKANRSGSSFGVFKAKTKEELDHYINEAFKFDNEILVESLTPFLELLMSNTTDMEELEGICDDWTNCDFKGSIIEANMTAECYIKGGQNVTTEIRACTINVSASRLHTTRVSQAV